MQLRLSQIWIVLFIVVSFGAGYFTAEQVHGEQIVYFEGTFEENEEVEKKKLPIDLKLFWEVWETVDKEYVEANIFDDKKAMYGAVKGLIRSIDDSYTAFMDPNETKDFQDSLDNKLEGIGAELTVEEGRLIVVSPLRDSPAEKAGLLPKDLIYKIDGEEANDMTIFDAVMAIRGEKGTDVVLTVIRAGEAEPFDISITRGKINIESVSYELREDKIAYVTINQFSDATQQEFAAIVSEMLLDEAQALILDLRFNGGGYLDISVDIMSEFIKGEQKIVTLKRRNAAANQVFMTNGEPRLPEIPIVVLINEGSASASEIVAGAVQDLDRGYVIGEQSFGKGSVQELISLADGSSLRMTVAKWLTPDNRDIDKVGITPNMVIKRTKEDRAEEKDPQLDAATAYVKNLIGR